jgi:hypothetical protein
MLERTRTILAILEHADWFSAVGQAEQSSVIVLDSWKQAMVYCSALNWENVQLEAANRLADALVKYDYSGRYQSWNSIADEVKILAEPFIESKITHVVTDNRLPVVFKHFIKWDMIHIGIATEYSDIVPVEFHALQTYWYIKGHFPCGWDGEFPNGKLIVY